MPLRCHENCQPAVLVGLDSVSEVLLLVQIWASPTIPILGGVSVVTRAGADTAVQLVADRILIV